jgi:hypothetical protein
MPMGADAPCARVPRSPGWIAEENQKPGDTHWRPSKEASTTVKGYLGEVSGTCGQTVDLHLSSAAPGKATVSAYRIGWYGGAGARLVWASGAIPVAHRGSKFSGPPLYMAEADWPTSVRILITAAWTPGYYVFDVRPAGAAGGGEAIPFVVRDDSGPSRSGTSPLLFQASVLTYQAYNGYGGYSTYEGTSALTRAREASFDRPYQGPGYDCPFLYDIPLAAEIEKRGLDVDYTTDIDVDQRPSQVAAHAALVVGGHSEYWTERMYDAAQAARDSGTNIAFFGANSVYWHTRLEASPQGADRRMAVYRYVDEDPAAKKDLSQATVLWRQAPLNRPEESLVGADFNSYGTRNGAFRILDPDSWILAGTGMTQNQELAESVAGEFDMVRPDEAATPQDIDVIAAAPVLIAGKSSEATMSYYTAPSGAGVFSAGITYWPCMVSDSCTGAPVSAATSAVLTKMTDNVLEAFSAGRAGLAHPSQYRPGPTPQALLTTAKTQKSVAVRAK